MRIIALMLIGMMVGSGCAPLVVTFPDGEQMTVTKLWGRAVATEYNNKESKKQYKATTKALIKMPEINLLKLPGKEL